MDNIFEMKNLEKPKTLDITAFAGIAQSVEQLIRNQQVVCSSHIASSMKNHLSRWFFVAQMGNIVSKNNSYEKTYVTVVLQCVQPLRLLMTVLV